MSANAWIERFETNRVGRIEPDWQLPCGEPPAVREVLARSLSHFQLGETGGGEHLVGCARADSTEADARALELFVGEEREHARLLEHLVLRLGGRLVRRHWSHSLFRLVRQALGLRFEVQVLVIVELVGTAYYEVVGRRTLDCVVAQTCELLLRDEAGHVAFHAARFRAMGRDWLPLERSAWEAAFQGLFVAALTVAWWDHGSALRALGSNWAEFSGRARRHCRMFLESARTEGEEGAGADGSVRAGAEEWGGRGCGRPIQLIKGPVAR